MSRRLPQCGGHQCVYLRGVDPSSLTAVLNFMYHGEASVSQAELNAFLAVAEDLSVKGLTQVIVIGGQILGSGLELGRWSGGEGRGHWGGKPGLINGEAFGN